ncbi:MAG: acyl carrier protein [Bdellovibrionota bacterium]
MYTKEEIYKIVSKILIEEFECDAEKLVPEVKLFEDLDLDSIDAVDLVVKLQNIIKKKVNPQDFKQIRTLEDVVVAVEKLVNEKV